VQKKDPTEDVMAAIARIVENPTARRLPGANNEPVTPAGKPAPSPIANEDGPSLGADGYSRLGPGPLPALRFRWTARRDGGEYYVDETIGDYSRPVTTGPMAAEDAIAFVDKQVKDARERFDRLKADMSVRSPEPDAEPNPDAAPGE
jgi:hypothetical protein